MAPRLDLHAVLLTICENVYFQPPPTIQMKYPCIVYARDDADTTFAGNLPYGINKRYSVTVIDSNPDSEIPGRVALLPSCVFERFFTADKLNHDVYQLFF